MTFPFNCTHDCDLDFSRSKFEIGLSQESEGRLTWNEKWCDSIIHDLYRALCVTVVGWVDVLESDRGDFRHRRTIDIFTYMCCNVWYLKNHCPMISMKTMHYVSGFAGWKSLAGTCAGISSGELQTLSVEQPLSIHCHTAGWSLRTQDSVSLL